MYARTHASQCDLAHARARRVGTTAEAIMSLLLRNQPVPELEICMLPVPCTKCRPHVRSPHKPRLCVVGMCVYRVRQREWSAVELMGGRTAARVWACRRKRRGREREREIFLGCGVSVCTRPPGFRSREVWGWLNPAVNVQSLSEFVDSFVSL